jgi:hypothetical protein
MKTATKIPCRPTTAAERLIIRQLSFVTMLPGSWDKRFARSMESRLQAKAEKGETLEITEKQAEQLLRMAHRYRRQIERRK